MNWRTYALSHTDKRTLTDLRDLAHPRPQTMGPHRSSNSRSNVSRHRCIRQAIPYHQIIHVILIQIRTYSRRHSHSRVHQHHLTYDTFKKGAVALIPLKSSTDIMMFLMGTGKEAVKQSHRMSQLFLPLLPLHLTISAALPMG